MRLLVWAVAMVFAAGCAAHAQSPKPAVLTPNQAIESWSKASKTYVPSSVRAQLAGTLVRPTVASGHPVSSKILPSTVEASIKESIANKNDLRLIYSENAASYVTSKGKRYGLNQEQAGFLQITFGAAHVSLSLSIFPVLRISVEPVPPQDYAIFINGERAELEENSSTLLTLIPYGNVEVKVERQGKPPCMWRNTLNRHGTFEVKCVL